MFRETITALVATLLFALGATAVYSNATAKSSTACGSLYTVERGDTLFRIADEAYSNGRLYAKIFKANRDLLPNMQSVEIGDQILIPCLDGTGPATRSAAMAPAPGGTTVAAVGFVQMADPIEQSEPFVAKVPFGVVAPIDVAEPIGTANQVKAAEPIKMNSPFETIEPAELAKVEPAKTVTDAAPVEASKSLRILSGAGFDPYAGKFLPAGGMVTDLITRGVKNVAPDRELRVSYINDWAAHLATLLTDDSFDVSFPWIKPDCSNIAALNETARTLCTSFEFSNPFFVVPVGYYSRVGDPLIGAVDSARLGTKRVCRPEGQFQFGPAQASLTAANVTIETEPTAMACLTRLMSGEIDVVNLVKSDIDDEFRRFTDTGQIAEIEGLATTLTLHAVVAKSSPNGLANLAVINQGLASLMASGEWFEVVVRHRSERIARLY